MANLIHTVLIKLKDGTELEDVLTDQEAFANIQAGNTLLMAVFSGTFLTSGGITSGFKNLSNNNLREIQDQDPSLTIKIFSSSTRILDKTDIHEFESFDPPVGQPPTPPPIPEEPEEPEEPPTTPPIPPLIISSKAVSQSLGVWHIEGDRIIGEILFIAQNEFPPALYGVNIRTLINVKDTNGITIVVKENTLNFTNEQRDERIFYNENAFGNQKVIIQSIVTSPDFQVMAKALDFDVTPVQTIPPIRSQTSLFATLPFIGISALLLSDALRHKGGNNGKKAKRKK